MVERTRSRRRVVVSNNTKTISADDSINNNEDQLHQQSSKKVKLLPPIEEHEEHEEEDEDHHHRNIKTNGAEFKEEEEEEDDDDDDEGEEEYTEPLPIGDVVRVSVEGGGEKKNHYNAFQFEGNHFQLEDPVLVTPEEGVYKPSVVVIKDIFQTEDGSLMITGQRFFRPEEALKKGGGTYEPRDARELFFSTQLDEIPANSVMHKCVLHLVPYRKPLPNRKEQPGFIIQKVYDYVYLKLRNLTERDCAGASPAA